MPFLIINLTVKKCLSLCRCSLLYFTIRPKC
jgi:hypothetical protein